MLKHRNAVFTRKHDIFALAWKLERAGGPNLLFLAVVTFDGELPLSRAGLTCPQPGTTSPEGELAACTCTQKETETTRRKPGEEEASREILGSKADALQEQSYGQHGCFQHARKQVMGVDGAALFERGFTPCPRPLGSAMVTAAREMLLSCWKAGH